MPISHTPQTRRPENADGNSEFMSSASIRAHRTTLSNSPFLTNINHEINTPMHGVISMLDLLMESGLTNTQHELVSIALSSAENLHGLLNNILDFSKIETETLWLRLNAFNPTQQIAELVKTYAVEAKKKDIQLVVHYPNTAQRLMIGDSARIGQVVENLLSNAVKFTASGQITVDVQMTPNPDDRVCFQVSVTDTGTGLSPPFVNDIFQKIIPGDASTTRTHNGAGLGLLISKKLIELMNGQIGVESHPGVGSKFWFSLDLALLPNPLAGMRVFFVDPDENTRNATELHLSQHDVCAKGFETAHAALNGLEQAAADLDPFRIGILDQEMAEIDGETFGIALKSDPLYKDIQLILLSKNSRTSDTKRFSQAGFSAVLRKPMTPLTMLDTLSSLAEAIQSGNAIPFLKPSSNASNKGNDFLSKSRVLVVDDSLINQMVAVRMLEKFGCRPSVASSGKAAIAMLAASEYDLVLMDCQMPELDGYQTTAKIRANEAGQRHTLIIGWTAYALHDGEDKCLAAGMDDSISKPIRPQALRQILSHWLPPFIASESAKNRASDNDDLDTTKEMFGTDFAELANLFRTDSPERINTLYRAVAAGDAKQVAKGAHALSGSSASIGATGLSALCKELEIHSKSSMPTNIMARLAEIDIAYSKIESRLRSMLE